MERIENEVASPCLRQCRLSEQRICEGCGRSVAEITGWRSMSADQKQQCVDDAAVRLDLMAMSTD